MQWDANPYRWNDIAMCVSFNRKSIHSENIRQLAQMDANAMCKKRFLQMWEAANENLAHAYIAFHLTVKCYTLAICVESRRGFCIGMKIKIDAHQNLAKWKNPHRCCCFRKFLKYRFQMKKTFQMSFYKLENGFNSGFPMPSIFWISIFLFFQ